MREVVVTTGSRLHFGLFAVNPELRRQFAGIGMMVDSPSVRLRAQLSESVEVTGPNTTIARARTFAARFAESCNVNVPVSINIEEAIPLHEGLGSGTQLALAIGTALARLHGIEYSTREIAAATGRAKRSTIGVFGFDHGGFIVDGGQTAAQSLDASLARHEMPPEWRIVLVTPDDATGLCGDAEKEAFARLPPMSGELSTQLDRLIANNIVPSLQDKHFDRFAMSLHEFGQLIGGYFAPAQGQVFCSAEAMDICDRLMSDGFKAVVQSSWGPTVAVMARNADEANAVVSLVGTTRSEIVAPMNHGAVVEPSLS